MPSRRASMLLVFAMLAPALAHAQSEVESAPPAEYEGLIEQALAESAEHRFEEARVLFRRAHAVFPNARALRGIGMVAFELRDYPDAIRHLRLALAHEVRPLTEEQRAEVEAIVERAYAFVGRYELAALPEGARVLVDGHDAEVEPDGTLLMTVGRHEVSVRTPARSWEGRWTVRGGEEEPLPIVFDPPAPLDPPRLEHPQPPPTPPPPDTTAPMMLTIAGAGVAAIGIGLLIAGIVDLVAVESAMNVEWSSVAGAYERAAPLTGAGIVSIGVGGAAAIAGGVWLAVSGDASGQPSAIGLRLGGRW